MLKRRLRSAGRDLPRDRLTRRGVALPAAGTGVLFADLSPAVLAADATARAPRPTSCHLGKRRRGCAALLPAPRGGAWLKVALLAAVGLAAGGLGLAMLTRPTPASRRSPRRRPRKRSRVRPGPTSPASRSRPGSWPGSAPPGCGPGTPCERLAFSPDGTRIAAWSPGFFASHTLTVYDAKTGRELRRLDQGHGHDAGELLAWLPDGRGVALVRNRAKDPGPLVWEFTDEKADPPPGKPRPGPVQLPRGPGARPVLRHQPADGQTIAVGQGGLARVAAREVRLCRLRTGVTTDALPVLKVVGTHPGNIGHLCFTPDGTTLVVFGQAKYLRDAKKWEESQLVAVWDVAAGKEKARFTVPRPATEGLRLAITVSDAVLAIGLADGDTSLWDLATGQERKLASGHVREGKYPVAGTTAVAFLPGGKNLVTSGRGAVKVWEVASGKLVRAMERHFLWSRRYAVSPGSRLIASAGGDGVIRLWDAATGADACPLPGHTGHVKAVAFTPDGRTAVTIGEDEALRWWDVATGAERRVVASRTGSGG